jgi:tetratricopeptide (TPR) repeat protein
MALTYRTGYDHRFGDRSYHVRIGLTHLSRADSVRLGQAKLGAEGLSPDLEELLAATAEGNPFFVEEVIKSLLESNVIRSVPGGYVLGQPVQALAVPNSIQAVIMARIDRLPDAPKKALQLASVIGREFSRRILDRIAEGPVAGGVLGELKRAELIYEKAASSEPTYLFKHALTHDVAYASLLIHRRKDVHHAIGRAIEEIHAERLADQYDVLAYHFSRAEDTAKAVDYLLKAAAKAVSASANHEALGIYRQALGLLDEADGPRRAEVLKHLATVTSLLADPEASLAYAEQALALFETLGDKRGAIAMHLHIQVLYTWRWDGAREDKALTHLQAAAALVENDPDTAEKGLIYQRTGHLLLHRGEPSGTLVWARKAVDLFGRLNLPMGTSLGTAQTYTGQIDAGIAYNEGNADGVFKTRNPIVMGVWGHELVLTLALVRDLPRARRWGERILPEVSKGTPVFEAMIRRPLALIYALAGDVARAEEMCRAVELIENKTLLGCIFEDAIAIAVHALRRGETEAAREYLELRLPVFHDRHNVVARGACSFALGLVHAEMGEYAEAEAQLLRSLAVLRNGDNVLFELWVLPALCEVHVKMQQLTKAAEDLQRGFGVLGPEQGRYGIAAPMLKARGVLAVARRDWADAAEAFGAAIGVNRQYGLPYDEAQAWYEWGLGHVAQGQRAEAQAKLDRALGLFEQAGAARDVARTLAAGS